jgi:hypothetical protein
MGEDRAHDLGLSRVDRPAAANERAVGAIAPLEVIAVGVATAGFAGLDATAKTTAGLVGEVLEEERVHRALEPDVQNTDLAFAESDEPYACELQALEQRGDVLLIAGEAIERLGDDDVEGRLTNSLKHRLISRPKRR